MIKSVMLGNAQEGELLRCDAIEHEGALWLVPEWLQNPTEGWMTPVRIIRISGFRLQKLPPGNWIGDYILNDPIPRDVLEGRTAAKSGVQFEVVERPDIQIPTGGVQ